jgi:hypothetical protein
MMNKLRLIAYVSFIAIFTTACGGGDSGSGSDSGNDDVTTPVVIPSPTMPKEILISELMIDPVFIPDFNGEWFEIQNPGTDRLNLRECVFSNAATNNFGINFDLFIEADEYVTFAISANPGFVPDFNYAGTGLTLSNTIDTLTLTCNGIAIDSRQYTMSSSGSSSSLSNNGNAKWCDDFGSIYNGDSGTPGFANIDCP